MGWRLYRRKQLLPGLSLGLSRSGPSIRFGVRGAGITVGGRSGLRATVGIPGSGVYYTATPHHRRRGAGAPVHRSWSYSSGPGAPAGSVKGCLIVLGVIVGLAIVAATYGLALIPIAAGVGLWTWWRRRQPDHAAARLIKQARALPGDEAVTLLHRAIELDPHGRRTLLACGDWFSDQHCWADAADCYAGFLLTKADWDVEARYVRALVYGGRLDEAVQRLEQLRAIPVLTDDSRASVTALLALAHLHRGDAELANALVSQEPLQRHSLGLGLQECLFLRAVSRYLMGQRSRAIGDLDRLYAVNASYPDLAEVKAEMQAGTFRLGELEPYPDWYPRDRRPVVSAGAGPETELDTAPTPQPLPQPLPQPPAAAAAPAGQPTSPWLSPDGRWLWDGTRWVPRIPNAEPPGG